MMCYIPAMRKYAVVYVGPEVEVLDIGLSAEEAEAKVVEYQEWATKNDAPGGTGLDSDPECFYTSAAMLLDN